LLLVEFYCFGNWLLEIEYYLLFDACHLLFYCLNDSLFKDKLQVQVLMEPDFCYICYNIFFNQNALI